MVNLSCTVEKVFPEPEMVLDWEFTNDYEGNMQEEEDYTDSG